MPTYQYACTACDERLEAVQTFTDAPLTECPVCEGRLRKVFSAVGVVFKGSGFYKNDSRDSKQPAAAKADGGKADGKDGGKGSGSAESTTSAPASSSDSGSGSGASKKPAAPPAAGSTSSTPASKSA